MKPSNRRAHRTSAPTGLHQWEINERARRAHHWVLNLLLDYEAGPGLMLDRVLTTIPPFDIDEALRVRIEPQLRAVGYAMKNVLDLPTGRREAKCARELDKALTKLEIAVADGFAPAGLRA